MSFLILNVLQEHLLVFRNVGFETFSKIYHSRVVPKVDYFSGIWGFGNLEMCQKIQQCALRFYLRVHPKTPLLALEGGMGWIHPNVRIHTEMLRFWNRVLNMDESRLTRKMFEYDYKRCKKNCCNDTKQLLIYLVKCLYLRRKPHIILENYKFVIIIYGKISGITK